MGVGSVNEGPKGKDEGVKLLKEKLEGISEAYRSDLVGLMGDRDLEGLPEEQQLAIQQMALLSELSAMMEAKVRVWLVNDKAFQDAFEKRRIQNLRSYGFQVDEALAKACVEGDLSALRLYYQRTGTLPVGGEYARMPEEAKTNKDLEGLISSIVAKAMKGVKDGSGGKGG